MQALATTNLSASAIAGLVVATQAQMEAASSVKEVVTPGRQQYHPGAAKAWASWNGAATSVTAGSSYNVTQIVRAAAGIYTITYTTPFSGNQYAVVSNASVGYISNFRSASAASVTILSFDNAGSTGDSTYICFEAFGDQ